MHHSHTRTILSASLLAFAVAPLAAGAVERISVASGGSQANSQSRWAAISADARYVVFNSDASNLVAGDTNGAPDIFLRDRQLGTTVRVSVDANGAQVAGGSEVPDISGDGTRIVFASFGKLVAGAGYKNCYLVDRQVHTVAVLDKLPNAQPASTCKSASIDVSGNRIALVSADALETGDADYDDVYVRDLAASGTLRVSRAMAGGYANSHSTDARISGDGSRVIFYSTASNLVAGDSNGAVDVFLAASDNSMPIVRVDVGPGNAQLAAPTVGVNIAATNANGSLLAFDSPSPALSGWAQFVATTLYLRVPSLDQTLPVSIPDTSATREGWGWEPDFDYTGRWLAFVSTDEMYVGGKPGVYVADLVAGTIARIGATGSDDQLAHMPRLSADGHGIVWYSNSGNQVAGDTNGTWDVFYADNPLWVEMPIFADGFEG